MRRKFHSLVAVVVVAIAVCSLIIGLLGCSPRTSVSAPVSPASDTPLPTSGSQSSGAMLPHSADITLQVTQQAPTLVPESTLPFLKHCSSECLLIKLPLTGTYKPALLDLKSGHLALLPIPDDYELLPLEKALSNDYLLLYSKQAEQPGFALYDLNTGKITANISQSPVTDCDFDALFKKLAQETANDLIPKGLGAAALRGGYQESLKRAWLGPEGNQLYFVDTGSDGFSHLNVYELETEQRTQLENEALFVESLLPSPDGSMLLLRKGVNPAFSSPTLNRFYLFGKQLELTTIRLPVIPANAYWAARWDAAGSLLFESYDTLRLQYTRLLRYLPGEERFETVWDHPYHSWLDIGDNLAFVYLGQDKTVLTLVQSTSALNEYFNSQCPMLIKGKNSFLLHLNCVNQGQNEIWTLNAEKELMRSDQLPADDPQKGPQEWILNTETKDEKTILHLRNNATGKEHRFETVHLRQTFWSPSARFLVFLSQNGLWLVDLETASLQNVFNDLAYDYAKLEALWLSKP